MERLAEIADEEISKQASEDMMTIAEHLMEKGMEKGRQEGFAHGMRVVAEAMLKSGAEDSFILKVTGLSRETLMRLKCVLQ